MELQDLASSLSGKERELSRLARELMEKGADGEADELAWFGLLEQAVMSLRRSARELEQLEASLPSDALKPGPQAGFELDDLPPEPAAPLPSVNSRSMTSASGVLAGHADVIPVSEILGFLSGLGKSGVLWVETEKEGFLVQLESGSVIYAQGDSPPKGQRLGEILLRHGAIGHKALEEAIAKASSEHEVLGNWLLREDLITPDDLGKALSEQAQLIFLRMFDSKDASYQFEDGQRMVESEDVRLNVIQLLLESARATDEARSMFEAQFGVPIGRPMVRVSKPATVDQVEAPDEEEEPAKTKGKTKDQVEDQDAHGEPAKTKTKGKTKDQDADGEPAKSKVKGKTEDEDDASDEQDDAEPKAKSKSRSKTKARSKAKAKAKAEDEDSEDVEDVEAASKD